MKEMFRKCVVRHVLSNQKPLITLRTISNQVHKSFMPYLTHLPSLILKPTSTRVVEKTFYPESSQNKNEIISQYFKA